MALAPRHRRNPLARFYRSHSTEYPAVFVQEEGQWRGYAANGSLQRANGTIPEAILSRTFEITKEEAQELVTIWMERARALQQPAASAPPQAPAAAGPVTAVPVAQVATTAPAAPRPHRSRRWIYLSAGAALVAVIAVVAALAFTGHLGSGADAGEPGSGSASTEKVSGDDLVAKVGDARISRQRLDETVAEFAAQYPGQTPDKAAAPDQYKLFQEDVLDYLVAYELAAQKAATAVITVTDEDVQAQMTLILKASFGGDQAKFDAAVQQQGLTMEQFRGIYKQSLLFKKVYAEVTKTVTVSDTAIQTYYDQHKTDTYQGKALADVKTSIAATLRETKQRDAWRKWLTAARDSADISYANGWTAPANAGTLVP